jgi:hypothetical protein
VRKVEAHISRCIVHNHKNQHNLAINDHIVMFGLIEERRFSDVPTKFYDREKILISLKLTVKAKVW